MYCASVLSHIHVAVHHGSHGSLGFVLVPLSSLSKSWAAAASKSFSVKNVQTPHGNSGNYGGGRSWLGLGLSLCAMPLLLIGSRRSGADQSNSEMLMVSMSSRWTMMMTKVMLKSEA